jgi:ATPase subunit of ABC transporter with duplicated ATPase domains
MWGRMQVTHDRYFLDNVAGWILELDRGAGIPFEGNYSQWLQDKDRRLGMEKRVQSTLQKQISYVSQYIIRVFCITHYQINCNSPM